MKTYNKLMLYFWLFVAVALFIVVTYMGFTEGFKKWRFSYVFALIALFAFLTRRWMMKRMEKHNQYLKEQEEASKE
ncbi:MAG: hypothetical protein QNK23_14225 [Crocinitomicaceae bacterium]|nr:hypothetical protein [Crocinitomicaceae bacterium]